MLIDLLLLPWLAGGFFAGFKSGAARYIILVAAAAISFLVAVRSTPIIGELLMEATRLQGPYMPIVSFVISFIASLLMLKALSQWGLKSLGSHLDLLNKVTGGMLMAIFGAFLYSTLLLFFQDAGIIKEEATIGSKLFEHLELFNHEVHNFMAELVPFFKAFLGTLHGIL